MTSHAKIVQLDQPKVEHVTSLTHRVGFKSTIKNAINLRW